jgi:hypothetical protein
MAETSDAKIAQLELALIEGTIVEGLAEILGSSEGHQEGPIFNLALFKDEEERLLKGDEEGHA